MRNFIFACTIFLSAPLMAALNDDMPYESLQDKVERVSEDFIKHYITEAGIVLVGDLEKCELRDKLGEFRLVLAQDIPFLVSDTGVLKQAKSLLLELAHYGFYLAGMKAHKGRKLAEILQSFITFLGVVLTKKEARFLQKQVP